jgi:subtilisin
MPRYVLLNRRAGKFTPAAKAASRATVATTLGLLGKPKIVADHDPQDPLARRVVVFDADAAHVASLRASLPPDAILEPAVQRSLHRRHTPMRLRRAFALQKAGAGAAGYAITVTGSGKPLGDIDVMFYVRDPGGQTRVATAHTDAQGRAALHIPTGHQLAFVEPIPYATFWIMLAEAPASGTSVACLPVAKAGSSGAGWWHDAMNVDTTVKERGAGIKVGVIDTGCGPHPNLQHVTLVGTFVDGGFQTSGATDVAEHGTHTTGLIGARPTNSGDYAGMAPGCELFHARVFKGEGAEDGPTQADLINAIDALSRDNSCDLINMSLGGGPPSQAEEDAIRDAAERGTLCVCSAGNESGPIDYPGAYPECAAVSAIGKLGWAPSGTFSADNMPDDPNLMGLENLFLASFSCFGPTLACTAPGVGIVSTVPDRGTSTGLYMEMDGTSMASPIACGTLAVILSQDATYPSLPRDISRTKAALLLLAKHCEPIGLATQYEGRGLPRV